MTNKKVGDQVTSTNINATPVTQINGTIIEIDIQERHALVKQDDGVTAWWGL